MTSPNTDPKAGFAKALNRHGYGFQYAVLKRLEDLRDNKRSSLIFEAAEFPVEAKGQHTRIDFVLRHVSDFPRPLFVTAECKRANPSHSNWCFVKAPIISRNKT